jgi:hypothetical protein
MHVPAGWFLVSLARAAFPDSDALAREALARFDADRDGTVSVSELEARTATAGVAAGLDVSRDGTVDVEEFKTWVRLAVPRVPRESAAADPAARVFGLTVLSAPASAADGRAAEGRLLVHVPDFEQVFREPEVQLKVGGVTTTANDAGRPPDLRASDHLYSGWIAHPAGETLDVEVVAGDRSWKGTVTVGKASATSPLPIQCTAEGTLKGLEIPEGDIPANVPTGGTPDLAASSGERPGPPTASPASATASPASTETATPLWSATHPLVVLLAALVGGLGVGVGLGVSNAIAARVRKD